MCGIAGILPAGDPPAESRLTPEARAHRLDAMLGALAHRGPDEGDTVHPAEASLGMCRLAIVGIDSGQQPIESESGDFVIVGNGEIYNAPALRRALEARGHRFRGGSDIEAVLHLFEEEGERALEQLNGMFAVAILDRRQRRVFIARDRLGIKPLFMASHASGIYFASELPAIARALPADAAELEVDRTGLEHFLTLGYIPHPRTIYAGVRRLPPGHYAWLDTDGGISEHAWWTLPDYRPVERSVEEWSESIEELLADSIALRTLGDVPAGAFLSGGLDSSLVLSFLSEHARDPVPSFTIGIQDPTLDETADAAMTAAHFGAEHHREVLPAPEREEIESLFASFGEPFADASLLPTHRVARLAARHVKFVLSGDGGDELFCGYAWLHHERRLRSLPGPVRGTARLLSPLLTLGQRATGANLLGKALRVAGDLASDPLQSFLRRRSLFPRHLLGRVLADGPHHPHPLGRHGEEWSGSTMELLCDLDRRHYLAGDILEKVDRATMRHSLEARVPFLDHRIVETAATIPIETLLGPGGEQPIGKTVLRRIAERRLPRELLTRPKRGFGIPVDRWLRSGLRPLVEDRLLDPAFRDHPWFAPGSIEQLVSEQFAGRSHHGHRLWALISLAEWLRTDAATRLESPILA